MVNTTSTPNAYSSLFKPLPYDRLSSDPNSGYLSPFWLCIESATTHWFLIVVLFVALVLVYGSLLVVIIGWRVTVIPIIPVVLLPLLILLLLLLLLLLLIAVLLVLLVRQITSTNESTFLE